MRRRLLLATVAVLAVGLCSCSGPDSPDAPQVVVTTNILGDVVGAILGDQLEVVVLMQPNADPHSFQISAQQASMMSEADLVVSNGLGLEEGLQQHLDRAASAGAPTLVAAGAVEALPYVEGDAAGTLDPHFWTDPIAMLDFVEALEQKASQIVGIDPDQLALKVDEYRDALTQLDLDMTAAFAEIRPERRALVTNHHVFGYLAHRYDFRIIGTVIPGGTTLAAPSAADLHDLSQAIRMSGVPTIFADSSQPDRLVQVLASEADIDVTVVELFTESLTEPGGGAASYLEMMYANTERITDGLTA